MNPPIKDKSLKNPIFSTIVIGLNSIALLFIQSIDCQGNNLVIHTIFNYF